MISSKAADDFSVFRNLNNVLLYTLHFTENENICGFVALSSEI
jgi:hypothetical protein